MKDAVLRRLKNNDELVRNMLDAFFEKTKPHKMFYKISTNEGAIFKIVDRLFQI